MSRALRYLPEGQMSSISHHQGSQDCVAEIVPMMRGHSGRLSGHRSIELDSDKTVDFSARKSSITKRQREESRTSPAVTIRVSVRRIACCQVA